MAGGKLKVKMISVSDTRTVILIMSRWSIFMKKCLVMMQILSTLILLPACSLPDAGKIDDSVDPGERVVESTTIPIVEQENFVADSPWDGSLEDVSHWLYLIDVNLEWEVVDQITGSAYEMIVIDYIPSEESNVDYPIGGVIEAWHAAEIPKLVIAYIDIGEAEDYRTYWQAGWRIGDPEWIIAGDPDGWEGNYPVAYWYDEWHAIWLDSGGLLQGILDAGFDGIYLDWVEAYSDENVVVKAFADGVDPIEEVIWWVTDLAEFARSQNPDFIVIGQNAAELAAYDEYVEIIDAIAQEQIWFDGGADNDPPGDCPLPRTEAEVDTDAYRESLSSPCQRQYDQFPESTLHVSSEWYLGYLAMAQSKGLTIFTVDYALDPENIAWVYDTSRELGFVPFVSNRGLDQYVPLYP